MDVSDLYLEYCAMHEIKGGIKFIDTNMITCEYIVSDKKIPLAEDEYNKHLIVQLTQDN